MKKILVVLLSLTLIFTFTGCTSFNNGAAEDIEIKIEKIYGTLLLIGAEDDVLWDTENISDV